MKSLQVLGDMSGRSALITGGAGYLGMAMAEALAEAGADVILLDLEECSVRAAEAQLTDVYPGHHKGLAINLADKSAIDTVPAFVENNFKCLDVLINCAALVGTSGLKGWATPLEDQDIYTWEKALEVNLTGAFYLIQKCQPLFEKSRAPSIINVSSIYGVAGQKMSIYEGMNYVTPAAYAASKGGLVQLTRYLATVLAPNIRVNCISPGGIERGQDKTFVERYIKMTPLERMGREEEFKGVVHFLASDLSAYVTGQNIIVDGGWSL